MADIKIFVSIAIMFLIIMLYFHISNNITPEIENTEIFMVIPVSNQSSHYTLIDFLTIITKDFKFSLESYSADKKNALTQFLNSYSNQINIFLKQKLKPIQITLVEDKSIFKDHKNIKNEDGTTICTKVDKNYVINREGFIKYVVRKNIENINQSQSAIKHIIYIEWLQQWLIKNTTDSLPSKMFANEELKTYILDITNTACLWKELITSSLQSSKPIMIIFYVSYAQFFFKYDDYDFLKGILVFSEKLLENGKLMKKIPEDSINVKVRILWDDDKDKQYIQIIYSFFKEEYVIHGDFDAEQEFIKFLVVWGNAFCMFLMLQESHIKNFEHRQIEFENKMNEAINILKKIENNVSLESKTVGNENEEIEDVENEVVDDENLEDDVLNSDAALLPKIHEDTYDIYLLEALRGLSAYAF